MVQVLSLKGSMDLDTCGILVTGGLAGGEAYPWATQTTEVLRPTIFCSSEQLKGDLGDWQWSPPSPPISTLWTSFNH